MDGFEGGNASPSKDPPKVAGGTCVESGATAVATAEETSNAEPTGNDFVWRKEPSLDTLEMAVPLRYCVVLIGAQSR